MRGPRRCRWLLVGAVVAAGAGCKSGPAPGDPAAGLKPADPAGRKLDVAGFFGPRKPAYGPPREEPVAEAPRRKPGDGWLPETEVALADVRVAGAFERVDGAQLKVEGEAVPAKPMSATERDRMLDDARQLYQHALQKDPTNRGALLGLARLYGLAGDKDRAVATMQAAVAAYPADHALVHRLAAMQCGFGDWAGAAASCRAALAKDPENRTYQKTLGLCLAHLEQWEEALATLRQVMPEAGARYFLGRVLAEADRPADARQQMEYALRSDPGYGPAREYLSGGAGDRPAPAGGEVQPVGHVEPAAAAEGR